MLGVPDFLWTLTAVSVCLLVPFVLWVKKKQSYFEVRGLPYVKPIFFLGAPQLWKSLLGIQQIGITHKEIYKEFKGAKIGGIFQGVTPSILVMDPELVNRVLIKDFSHFHDRGIKVDVEVNPLEAHLFMLNGDKWRTMRAKLSPTFTSSKLKWMYPQMEICSDMLLDFLKRESAGGAIEIKDLLARFTTDVIGSCAFGYEPSSLKDPNTMFRKMGNKIFLPSFYFVVIAALRFLVPDLFFKFKIRTVPGDVNDFFMKVIKETMNERQRSGVKRNDFVQLLLQLREKGSIDVDPRDFEEDKDDLSHHHHHQHAEEKIDLTDDLLTAQAFVFFVAGFETSATSMSYTLYQLAKNPEIQEKARKEVRQVKRRFGWFTYEAVKELHYLEACFNEATRMYPPIPVLFRECTKTLVLEDGTTIEKGLQTLVPVIGLHYDPDLYPEPDVYRPERFAEGQGSTPGSFLPFGDGPRICIGKRFALVEVKLCLAQILDKYRLTVSPKTVEPLEMNPRSFIMQPKGGVWLRFQEVGDDVTGLPVT